MGVRNSCAKFKKISFVKKIYYGLDFAGTEVRWNRGEIMGKFLGVEAVLVPVYFTCESHDIN